MTPTQLTLLSQSPLFKNISLEDLNKLIPCLGSTSKNHKEGEMIITQGMTVSYIYIVLKGQVEIIKSSFSGQKNIIAVLGPGKLFGEGIVCTALRSSPVSAVSLCDTTLLCIPYKNIIVGCEHHCGFHHQLIYNMMLLLGQKNYTLNMKMDLLLLKGLREKLATYLLQEYTRQASTSFILPLNRNQLAEYLNVSRPSMCRELGRMKDDGLIDYYQNSFKLLDLAALKKLT